MNKQRWLIMGISVSMTVVTTGAALALTQDEFKVRKAAEVYAPGMSLETISTLSQGKPGKVAPPCPAEELVTKLKKRNMPVGPCDPFPEDGQPFMLPGSVEAGPPAPGEGPNDPICSTSQSFGTTASASTTIDLPCAPGLRSVSQEDLVIKGEHCVRVTYIPRQNAAELVETVCPSRPVSPSGVVLTVPGPDTIERRDAGDK